MKYGHLELHIEELLKEKGISKNTICKELEHLDIQLLRGLILIVIAEMNFRD